MEQLPIETLHEIFVLLNQVDKIQCMLVCHKWERVIKPLSLFHTIQLYSQSAVKKFTKKLQQEQYYGSKVERLLIDFSDYDEGVDLNALLPLLPNLREFIRSANLGELDINDAVLQFWSKSIERISESSRPSIIYRLLSQSICVKLESIYISFDIRSMIPLLRNAPSLKNLTIATGKIAVHELELLHTCTPSLKTLRFIRIEVESFSFEGYVESAPSISDFIFDNVVVNDHENERYLLQYINAKYPNLLNFKYTNKYEYMDCNQITEINAFNLFNQGWSLLFNGLGSQLKTLCLGRIVQPGYLIDSLDNAGCQITCLKLKSLPRSILRKLAQSNQAKYIQVLRLEDVKVTSFEFLINFTSLEKIKLATSLRKKPLNANINNILKNCAPTLLSLSFKGVTVSFEFGDTATTLIKKLSFNCTPLPLRIDDFISRYIPKLSVLKLVGCDLQRRILNLPLVKLSYCHIEDTFPNCVRSIIISTLENNKKRCIKIKDIQPNLDILERHNRLDARLFPALKSQPFNENGDASFLTLRCSSLNKLVVLDIW